MVSQDRKPVDPPPIVQLKINPVSDPGQAFLQSKDFLSSTGLLTNFCLSLSGPYFFMSVSLVGRSDGSVPQGTLGTALAGTLVSSLHRLKDTDNNDGAFFVFGDLSVKVEGSFRLQFNLYEMRGEDCFHIAEIKSNPFPVHSTKNWPGMAESTFLTRSFSDQGVRLRLRKEPRSLLRKRGPAHDDYAPRRYNKGAQSQSQEKDQQSSNLEGQDALRLGYGEQVEEQHHASPTSYDPRPRNYSQQAGVTYSPYAESSKRPRTASEGHVPLYNGAIESAQFTERPYPAQNTTFPNSYLQQSPQPGNFYNHFTPAPQVSTTTARDHYFAQRLNSLPTNPSSTYDPNSARSPQSPFFPPQPRSLGYVQSPQQPHYNNMAGMISPTVPQRVETTQAAFEGLGLATSGQPSPGMRGADMSAMVQPTYGRMNTSSGYEHLPLSATSRRDSYQYQQNTQNMSVGNLMYSSGPTMQTSAASGPLEHSY
jgi:hypothetical protein